VLSGALLLRRSTFPYRSFSSLHDASAWLAPLVRMDVTKLASVTHAFHRQLAP